MGQTLGERTDKAAQARLATARATPYPRRRPSVAPFERSMMPARGEQPMSRHLESAPTLATVAEAAGVSRQTVSNALNSPELLRPDTLARVQEAIEALGYSPNRAARSLRTRSSHLIGLRVDPAVEDSANALMDRFVHSLVESTKVAGYHVLLFTGGDGTDSSDHPDGADAVDAADTIEGYDELLRSAAVDAFVVTDTYRGNPQAALLEQRGIPFVAFGRPWEDPGSQHPWVDVDGRAGVAAAVDHLVAIGHTRTAWIGWQKGSFIGEDRASGWVERMHAHRLSTSRLSARGEDSLDYGCRAAHALLVSEQPTAFVCVSDTVALGVLRALSDLGLKPGEDVAVVGFDDSVAAQVSSPALTSVRQPLEEVAVEIVRLLDARLAHRPVAGTGSLLVPRLAVRETG